MVSSNHLLSLLAEHGVPGITGAGKSVINVLFHVFADMYLLHSITIYYILKTPGPKNLFHAPWWRG